MNGRRLARIFVRIILPAVIIIAVGWQFVLILRRPELDEVSYAFRIQWLLPAAIVYLMAHTIWASFWWMLLHNQGYPASFGTGLRAYFVSQYGKYIPGKVWVILIRVVMLGGTKKDRTIVGVTATYETVTSMAAGAILAAILLPILSIDLLGFGAQKYVLIAIAAIPLAVALIHRLIVQIARRKMGPDAHLPNMNLLLLLRGLIQAAVGWFVMGISVWMVMQAVRPETVDFTLNDWVRLTAINCAAYVLGFIILVAPAGGGVREWVLKILLATELASGLTTVHAEGLAVVVALVLRLVWTLAELIVAVILYRCIPAVNRPTLIPTAKEDLLA